jgi:hypothetical protein
MGISDHLALEFMEKAGALVVDDPEQSKLVR